MFTSTSDSTSLDDGFPTLKNSRYVGKLIATILSAEDLVPRDINGKSDPYVQVSLYPSSLNAQFHAVNHVSKIVKANLNPNWNFEYRLWPNFPFHFPDSASLILHFFDYDIIGKNDDLLGMVVIDFAEIETMAYDEIVCFDLIPIPKKMDKFMAKRYSKGKSMSLGRVKVRFRYSNMTLRNFSKFKLNLEEELECPLQISVHWNPPKFPVVHKVGTTDCIMVEYAFDIAAIFFDKSCTVTSVVKVSGLPKIKKTAQKYLSGYENELSGGGFFDPEHKWKKHRMNHPSHKQKYQNYLNQDLHDGIEPSDIQKSVYLQFPIGPLLQKMKKNRDVACIFVVYSVQSPNWAVIPNFRVKFDIESDIIGGYMLDKQPETFSATPHVFTAINRSYSLLGAVVGRIIQPGEAGWILDGTYCQFSSQTSNLNSTVFPEVLSDYYEKNSQFSSRFVSQTAMRIDLPNHYLY